MEKRWGTDEAEMRQRWSSGKAAIEQEQNSIKISLIIAFPKAVLLKVLLDLKILNALDGAKIGTAFLKSIGTHQRGRERLCVWGMEITNFKLEREGEPDQQSMTVCGLQAACVLRNQFNNLESCSVQKQERQRGRESSPKHDPKGLPRVVWRLFVEERPVLAARTFVGLEVLDFSVAARDFRTITDPVQELLRIWSSLLKSLCLKSRP